MSNEHETLCLKAATRDPAAVESLVARHLSGLRAFIRLRLGPEIRARESASDLAQSVCREVLEQLDGFDYRGEAAFKAWLFTLATSKIRDRHRFHNREMRDPAREEHGLPIDAVAGYESLTPSRAAIDRENIERLERAFDQLPEHYREILTLSRIVGLRPEEIAEQTGRTTASVRHVLGRAIVRLAEHYDEHDDS